MNPLTGNNALAATIVPGNTATRYAWLAFLALAGTLAITLSAKVQVPFWPVPATLQTLAIFAIAAAYGRNLAVATMVLYLLQGAAGLPVFAGTPEKGIGIAYMAGPTGGYLAGFVVMAAIAGWAADRGWSRNPLKLGSAMLAGELIMLVLGTLWIGYLFGAEKMIAWGVGPFIVTDLVKLALAAVLVPALWSLTGFLRR
jgi:biotin transport system substrate-specific component